MGMFGFGGGKASSPAAQFDPSALNGADKLMLFGALLKDAVGAYNGEPSDNIMAAQGLLAQRQQRAQQNAILGELTGANAPGVGTAEIVKQPRAMFGRGFISKDVMGPPSDFNFPSVGSESGGVDLNAPVKQATPMGLDDPRLPGIALAAKRAGMDISSYLDVLKANQPDVRYDRGFGYNGKTGQAIGKFHPDLDKGQVPLYDENGNFAGVRNADGAVQSAAEMAGAVEGAKAKANAPFQFQTVTGPDGRPRVISNATAAALGAKGGIIAAGQSPAQQAADTATATAGANANVQLPQTVADAQQAIQLIDTLKANPALRDRTGWHSLLPALPGTPGAAFDAADDQLRGKLFMQAYAGLKGGGQITEVEGKKATQAIARLSRSQSSDDYVKALDDLREVIAAGAARAQQQPGRLQPQAAGGRAAPPRANLSSIPVADRVAEARRRGLIP